MSGDGIDKNKTAHNKKIETQKQNLNNKKIYFDVDGTEIKIGYDEQTGTGFVEIIKEQSFNY